MSSLETSTDMDRLVLSALLLSVLCIIAACVTYLYLFSLRDRGKGAFLRLTAWFLGSSTVCVLCFICGFYFDKAILPFSIAGLVLFFLAARRCAKRDWHKPTDRAAVYILWSTAAAAALCFIAHVFAVIITASD